LLALLAAYRFVVSPIVHAIAGPGSGCRFTPTCSEYAAESIRRFGAARGTVLALRRLGRCHPWHPGGHDPVAHADVEGTQHG